MYSSSGLQDAAQCAWHGKSEASGFHKRAYDAYGIIQICFEGFMDTLGKKSSDASHGRWALTVGLGTLVPGFALFKSASLVDLAFGKNNDSACQLVSQKFGLPASRLFTVTGAVEAERGAEEEYICIPREVLDGTSAAKKRTT